MSVRLRYRGYDVAMPEGEFVIGRGTECQLCLSDPIVSRKHAIIHATTGFVVIEDLGSRNGVIVNGERVDRRRVLSDGDVIVIGGQELSFHAEGSDRKGAAEWKPPVTGPHTPDPAPPPPDRARIGNTTVGQSVIDADDPLGSFDKVWKVSLGALQAGRASEAERVLERPLAEVLSRSRCGLDVDPGLIEAAARGAACLAAATRNGYWIDYVFDLCTLRDAPLPDDVLDALGPLAGVIGPVDDRTIRLYVTARKKAAATQPGAAASYAKLEALAGRFGVG